jgi:hypothetical protein
VGYDRSVRATRLSLANFFFWLMFFGLLAMTARNAVDPDLWWHLRTGQLIVETGHIPHADPFSFTRTGSPWVSHEWLSEVVFYGIWKSTGAAGLIIFSSVMTTAGFMLLYLRCPKQSRPSAAATAVALGALAAAPSWGVRPQMFTFVLASLLLWLLERGQERPWALLWIPPLFLLWLNLHAGFAFGPALLVAWGVGLMWETVSGQTPWSNVRPQLICLGVTLLACIMLVPLNPSGAQLYRYPLDVLQSAGMRSFINEWLPPDFHQLNYFPLFLVWAALLWALATNDDRPKARLLLPLLLTFLAAFDAVRHVGLLVLLATPVIAGVLTRATSGKTQWDQAGEATIRRRFAFRATVLLLMAAFAAIRWTELARQQAGVEAEQFPQQAAKFLRAHTLPSRLFVYYDWGGYAIWKLYPEYRVFIDGRADLYGDHLLKQFQQAAHLSTGWNEVLNQSGAQAALVPSACALAEGLLLDAGWRVEYRDPQAILFVRIHMATEPASFVGYLPK